MDFKRNTRKINVSNQAMAFVPKKNGLKVNAEYHKKNIFILEMDIKKFFRLNKRNPSVSAIL